MSAQSNLNAVLQSMNPVLMDGEWVFVTSDGNIKGIDPLMTFKEQEGITSIIPREVADQHGLEYESVMKQITMNIHTSLELVGFTAAFSTLLGKEGISVNVVAGYYHDHLFVKKADAERAMVLLQTS